ncbi:MAG TPA: hypothetical protein VFE78_12865 [Gemmataceae bacterium]|jgi:hypothetical protein|nr:hypothetical protein [Gemmataceae bacterium]
MLSDADVAKLCHGRVIKAEVYQSSGKDAAGPHYAVILDTDEQVKAFDNYFVAVISHNDTIDSTFIIPVPPKTGLTGFIVCSWVTEVQLPGITQVCGKLDPPEMVGVLRMVRAARQAKRGSTQS